MTFQDIPKLSISNLKLQARFKSQLLQFNTRKPNPSSISKHMKQFVFEAMLEVAIMILYVDVNL